MYDKVYQATHPTMLAGAGNQELRDLYLIGNLFSDGRVVLNYSHNERLIIGGACPRTWAARRYSWRLRPRTMFTVPSSR